MPAFLLTGLFDGVSLIVDISYQQHLMKACKIFLLVCGLIGCMLSYLYWSIPVSLQSPDLIGRVAFPMFTVLAFAAARYLDRHYKAPKPFTDPYAGFS